MWSVQQAPTRLQRSSSMNSTISDRSSTASSEDFDSFLPRGQSMWAAPPASFQERDSSQQNSNVARLSQKFGGNALASISVATPLSPPMSREQSRSRESGGLVHDLGFDDDGLRSRSSTLGGTESEYEYPPEKTPTPDSMSMKKIMLGRESPVDEVQAYIEEFKEDFEPRSEASFHGEESRSPASIGPTRIAGPLERQFQDLLAKIIWMEQDSPLASVTPEEYDQLTRRVQTLEDERRTWQARHEALFALRDEDVSNVIKTRGLLAKARRDLESMTKLRDDDLTNLQAVRVKLAEATRKLEKFDGQSGRGSPSPSMSRGRPSSMLLERRDTTDLFAAAKAAALEQRTLELEKRNEDLLTQVEALKAANVVVQGASTQPADDIEDINRVAAHKAWKETVADLNAKLKTKDDEITRLRAAASTNVQSPPTAPAPLVTTPLPGTYDWHRAEALHEEHASYRERMGGKMQRLRADKEELQRELHRREDECHTLEAKVLSLQRRVAMA